MTTATAPNKNTLTIKTTKVYEAILQALQDGKRRILLEGGTSSSKTYSALESLVLIAQKTPSPILISVVSESLPHLKRGAIRDFFNILDEGQDSNPYWSKTEFTYRRAGWLGVIEFFGADDESKVRGPRRDLLFINEGNNIPWETARGLDIRTSTFTIVDWNPVSEFWAHEYWIPDDKVNAYDHSTYLDAATVLPRQVIEDIESYRDKDPNWWNIYGLGLIGKIEGLVYPQFDQVDELPTGAYFYGLDFGFSSDPTVLVKNVILGADLYSQEMFYDYSGLTNDQIARKMELAGVRNEPVYPDPDEPKSMEELRRHGFNIQETVKGKGTVDYGIQKVNQYYHHWTKDSVNCIKEQRNFRFIKDRITGDLTDRTTHTWSHGMCLIGETLIKTKRGDRPIKDITTKDYVLTHGGWCKVLDSWMTSPATEVQTVKFSNGQNITGTPSHEVFTKNKGFIPLNTLRYADIIEICGERQLSIMVKSITAILRRQTGLTGCTIEKPISVLTLKLNGIFTDKCGLMLMEKFPKVAKFTTRMITRLTTLLEIWSAYLQGGITSTIPPLILSGGVNGLELTLENIRLKQMHGMLLRRDKHGIGSWGNCLGKVESHISAPAIIVGEYTSQGKLLALPSSAQISVSQPIAERQGKIILRRFVDGVVKPFKRIGIDRGKVAPVYVLSVSEPHEQRQPVFDLTVEKSHNFYANGILVHNSARRYAVATIKKGLGGSARPVKYGIGRATSVSYGRR